MIIDSNFAPLMERVFSGHTLNREESEAIMDAMIDGHMSDVRVAAVLTGLRLASIASQQEAIVGALASILRHSAQFRLEGCRRVVSCGGSGRGGSPSNHVSIMAAIVASAAGAEVVQFGSKSLTQRSGCADLLEALGIGFAKSEEETRKNIVEDGIAFLYATAFYPRLKHIGAVRKSLGFHTVFDVLLPLVNPVYHNGQVVNVYDRNLMHVTAEALVTRGRTRGLVVFSEDGSDDISSCCPVHVLRVNEGSFMEELWTPSDFGLCEGRQVDFGGGPVEEGTRLLLDVLGGKSRHAALVDAVCVNAGALLWCAGVVPKVREGFGVAKKVLVSGEAHAKLQHWRKGRS